MTLRKGLADNRSLPQILLAIADVGLGLSLQELLERGGHEVIWDTARAEGPGDVPPAAELVVLPADEPLDARVAAWRDLDPPPAVVVADAGSEARARARAAGAMFADTAAADADVLAAVEHARRLRFAARLDRSHARGALGLGAAAGTDDEEALRIVAQRGRADLDTVRASLSPRVHDYVTATELVGMLREHRALQVPEVDLCRRMLGAQTVQTLVTRGGMEGAAAARLVWTLACVGALRLTPVPPDAATPERRAVCELRHHLRARAERLRAASHYDVLEVPANATLAEIDHACSQLAVRYAPDRTGAVDLGDHTHLRDPLWEQIRVARQVLRDDYERARYDGGLAQRRAQVSAPWAFEPRNPREAEVSYRRGQQALVDGQAFKAVSAMAAACRASPDHPDYEASLAWARFRAELARGKERGDVIGTERAAAEAALAGRRPWPRALVALALLCASDGDADAARWHLREALTCDPTLPAARQLLGRL